MDTKQIAAELKKIEDRNGRLTPAAVLEAAKNRKHPLHGEFTWDDSVAGHQWRLQQARQLINGVQVQIETTERTIQSVAYIRDPSVAGDEQGYRSILRLAKDSDDSRDAVLSEFSRAASHLRRARDIATALGYAKDIDKLVNKVVQLGDKIESATAG